MQALLKVQRTEELEYGTSGVTSPRITAIKLARRAGFSTWGWGVDLTRPRAHSLDEVDAEKGVL